MKELARIHKSEALRGMVRLPVELADDGASLFEWSVRLCVDEESTLGKDLAALKAATQGEVDSILVRVSFPEDYPFAPPFFRIAAPYVAGGFVQRGGALCTELLTQQGWASSYTMEAVLMQVASILAHPRTHIASKAPAKYTEEAARKSHRLVLMYHAQHGWGQPPPELG
jgi:ubiquitin-conjugating enzyme E2 Q